MGNLRYIGHYTSDGIVVDWEVPDQPAINTVQAHLDPVTRKCSWCFHRHSSNFLTVRADALYHGEMPPRIYQSCLACEQKFHHTDEQIEDEDRRRVDELVMDADTWIPAMTDSEAD